MKKGLAQRQVFINCPFDSAYAPLFLALVSGIVAVGCIPRCVLELPTGARLSRILKLIQECGASVHDLSRVSLSRSGGSPVPRFNMPFEAGIAYAHSELTRGRHSFFVLEKVPYRLQRSLSDLNGIDPFIHKGRVDGVLRFVLNSLVADDADIRPSVSVMHSITRNVSDAMKAMRRNGGVESFFERDAFKLATITATRLAREEGLLPDEKPRQRRRASRALVQA